MYFFFLFFINVYININNVYSKKIALIVYKNRISSIKMCILFIM